MLGPTFRLLGFRAPLCCRAPLGPLAPHLAPGQAPRQVHHRVMVRELAPHPTAALESLLVEEMEEPRVEEVPRDGVVVRVSHCAVHWVDLLMMAGQYQQAPPLPYTPGMEYSGVVAAAPPSSPHQPGDQVPAGGVTSHGGLCTAQCAGVRLGPGDGPPELRALPAVRRHGLLLRGAGSRHRAPAAGTGHGAGRHTQWSANLHLHLHPHLQEHTRPRTTP